MNPLYNSLKNVGDFCNKHASRLMLIVGFSGLFTGFYAGFTSNKIHEPKVTELEHATLYDFKTNGEPFRFVDFKDDRVDFGGRMDMVDDIIIKDDLVAYFKLGETGILPYTSRGSRNKHQVIQYHRQTIILDSYSGASGIIDLSIEGEK